MLCYVFASNSTNVIINPLCQSRNSHGHVNLIAQAFPCTMLPTHADSWSGPLRESSKMLPSPKMLYAQLIMCRNPAFPRTPASLGFGLRSRLFLPLRNPSTLPLSLSRIAIASTGNVAVWSASEDQLPCSSSTICTPPPLLACRDTGCGLGLLKDVD